MSLPRGKPRRMDRPEPGFWLVRLVKNGPLTPACIQYERTEFEPDEPDNRMCRSPILTARIAGEIVPLDRIWHTRGEPITKQEYDFRVADAAWARVFARDEPIAAPARPIDPLQIPLPF